MSDIKNHNNKKLTVKNITKYGIKSLPITLPALALSISISCEMTPFIDKRTGYLHTKTEISSDDINNQMITEEYKLTKEVNESTIEEKIILKETEKEALRIVKEYILKENYDQEKIKEAIINQDLNSILNQVEEINIQDDNVNISAYEKDQTLITASFEEVDETKTKLINQSSRTNGFEVLAYAFYLPSLTFLGWALSKIHEINLIKQKEAKEKVMKKEKIKK